MKPLKNMTGDALEQMIDYKVVDQNGKSIGSLHSLWSDPTTGGVEFLGVKTGWLFGHNHVVPAEKASVDESQSVIRLPYTELFIKEAPSIAADAEITEEEEADIYKFYGLNSPAQAPAQAPAETAAATSLGTLEPDGTGARWRRVVREDEDSFETVAPPDASAESNRQAGGAAN